MTHDQQAYVEIAARLRGLRDALGLEPEDLAAQIDVPVESVHAYESGAQEIPVGYLYAIAKTFNVDLSVLISGSEAHLNTFSLVRKGRGMSVDRRKDYDYKNLAYKFHGRKMEPFLIEAPPKPESELHFNEHPGQEFIYMLEGRLELTLGDQVVVLNEGDSIYFMSRTPHALRGLDGQTARFLDVLI